MDDHDRMFMRRAFLVCAASAEDMAIKVESGELPMDAPTALRMLATMFRSSAEHK